ncbi:hypothetical protein [Pseudorhodobacter sp.]|uniref:hypothetical protein n=1 Tax=Pseudorhodobacter sp. TaxID=1934400 RepID=UPI0026485413|nr:hypothetical protein [Pseudorhodobacter sp.]MDN5786519.1 hypothetical protein [Pseudorhodobacter sp.]
MTLRFAAPIYPGGRHCLLCGAMTAGAVFPPLEDPRSAKKNSDWVWRLFPFGANPAREGRAKDEATAKGHLTAAFAITLAEAGLMPIKTPKE